MTPIHQALHTAARTFAQEAHLHWLAANRHAERCFTHAVTGRQLERILAETQHHTHRALYQQNLTKANRAREMMK
jgi:hypothetical protein